LQPLTVKNPSTSFYINDGDIPCTPEEEPAFSYAWNFCADVTAVSVDKFCSSKKKSGVALQWLDMTNDGDCYVIGNYDPKQDDLYYSLLDSQDPTKGISMKYPDGDVCEKEGGVQRSATLDVVCDNVKSAIVSASEPSVCDYHLTMRSYYGCPTVCFGMAHDL
jgi:hypothetical protein